MHCACLLTNKEQIVSTPLFLSTSPSSGPALSLGYVYGREVFLSHHTAVRYKEGNVNGARPSGDRVVVPELTALSLSVVSGEQSVAPGLTAMSLPAYSREQSVAPELTALTLPAYSREQSVALGPTALTLPAYSREQSVAS